MFSGSLVAAVTPMRRDGAIDFDAWAGLVEFHVASGTSGFVVGGTTGESATLSEPELRELVVKARAVAAGRMPVIAGAGTSGTESTVARVRWLTEAGVDALLVVTPAYNRPTQEGLFRHYEAVDAAARVPLILYNVPSRTAVDLLPSTVARLAALANVKAVKEAVASMSRIAELVALAPPGFDVLSGDDPTARQAIAQGARGVISVTANVAPRLMADMVAAALAKDMQRAGELDARLADLHQMLFIEPNPIPAKWALARMGLVGEGIRLPLTPLETVNATAVLRALSAAGISAH